MNEERCRDGKCVSLCMYSYEVKITILVLFALNSEFFVLDKIDE